VLDEGRSDEEAKMAQASKQAVPWPPPTDYGTCSAVNQQWDKAMDRLADWCGEAYPL